MQKDQGFMQILCKVLLKTWPDFYSGGKAPPGESSSCWQIGVALIHFVKEFVKIVDYENENL